MSKRVLRDLEKLFSRYQCTVDEWNLTGRNTLRIKLRAPDGVHTETMSFSNETGSATKYLQGNEQMVRRFALAHPRTAVTEAIKQAVVAEKQSAPPSRFLAVSSLIPADFKPHPYQVSVIDEITNPVAEQAAPVAQTTMTTTTNTTTTEKTEKLKRQLDRKEVHQLWKWCRENVPQGLETTVADLAREATGALGFGVSEYSMKEALDLEEIKLGEPPKKGQQDRAWILACVLKNLMIELKLDVPEALQAIVERRKVSQ